MAKQTTVALSVVNPHTAGIDIGSRSHWVAVDHNKENVRSFGIYTNNLIGNLFCIYGSTELLQ